MWAEGAGGLIIPAFIQSAVGTLEPHSLDTIAQSFYHNADTRPAAQEVPLCFVLDLYFWPVGRNDGNLAAENWEQREQTVGQSNNFVRTHTDAPLI